MKRAIAILIIVTASSGLARPQVYPPGQNPSGSRRNPYYGNQPRRLFLTNADLLSATNSAATNSLTNSQAALTSSTNSLPAAQVSTNRPSNLATDQRFSTNSPASTRAMITPAQRQHINLLAAQLNAIRPGAQISPLQKQTLLNTLRFGALGPTKPSADSLNKLINDLASAWPARGFSPQQKAQLALDLSRTLNCQNLSPAEAQLVINDARRVFQSSALSSEVVESLTGDLVAIVNEVQQTQPVSQPQPLSQAQTNSPVPPRPP